MSKGIDAIKCPAMALQALNFAILGSFRYGLGLRYGLCALRCSKLTNRF
jgi:hypothetical protein